MKRKVLLCDDETHILRAAEIKLTRAGYDVRCAFDGQEAWELIEQEAPDILITDVQMPRLDGLQLSQRVRQHAPTKDLPIFVLTARGFESALQEVTEKWGVLAVFPKPFSCRELLASIEIVLSGQKLAPRTTAMV